MNKEQVPRIGFVTLGVADVERTAACLAAVLQREPRRTDGGLVQFELPSAVLALMPVAGLVQVAGAPAAGGAPGGWLVSLHLAGEAEVRAAMGRVEAAGGRVTRAPELLPWGVFAGFFEGPEGHAFELGARVRGPG